ncbi:MAG: hypothetical protein JSS97_13350 [Actinobacteria bacterium]|nr:hypothetical protein [Actinomycetota bacterium]
MDRHRSNELSPTYLGWLNHHPARHRALATLDGLAGSGAPSRWPGAQTTPNILTKDSVDSSSTRSVSISSIGVGTTTSIAASVPMMASHASVFFSLPATAA